MKILVCIDDDPILEEVLAALEWSLDAPKWSEILALHVVPGEPVSLVGMETSSPGGASLLTRVRARLSALPVQVQTILAHGDTVREVVRQAEACEADLIVLGALEERRDFLAGSTVHRIVSMAGTDVLVVRRSASEDAVRPDRSSRLSSFRALVAVDGSLGSEAGIDAFARKLRARSASIRLVHVVETGPLLFEVGLEQRSSLETLELRAQEVLARAKKSLGSRGLEADCEWRRGSPAGQILDAARDQKTDLIVVGSRGRSALREMVLGSTTHRILRHAPCTVLCARGWAMESKAHPLPWSSEQWASDVGLA
jgi:nucleotide-binding universal stress UspA family protein